MTPSSEQSTEITIPAARTMRWYESQIAGMVGQIVTIDGAERRVVFAIPVDGSPEDGASAMTLRLEPLNAASTPAPRDHRCLDPSCCRICRTGYKRLTDVYRSK